VKRYQLTVSGFVDFHKDGRDDQILHCLQGLDGGPRFDLAIQTLQEQAVDVSVNCLPVEPLSACLFGH